MSQNKFVIWGQPNCLFCNMAKMLLKSKKLEYEYRELGVIHTKQDLDLLVPGVRSVPQIFFENGRHIGGYNELVEYLNSAKI